MRVRLRRPPRPLLLMGVIILITTTSHAGLIVPRGDDDVVSLPSANFFHASRDFGSVTGSLVPIPVDAGCIPRIVPPPSQGDTTLIALFDILPPPPPDLQQQHQSLQHQPGSEHDASGCTSFADVIGSPEFVLLNATVSLFVLPPQSSNFVEGFVDPIGSSSCGGGSGAALVVISRASYDALINLNATNVTVTSDEGEWVRMGQSAPFLAERIAFGLLFWPIALWSLLLGAAAVVKEGRSYDVRKYSNTIYWLLFASATLLAVDCTVDPYGFNGLLTVGQWMYIRYAGSMATLGMTCLLISAWARVVAVVPISKLSWLAACLIQIAIFGCYTVMVVTCMYAGSRFTVLVAAGPRYSSMALSFAITGSLQFVLCCSSLFFGVWLLIVLTRVSSPTSSHSVTMVKTTLLMLASSGVQLMFGVLTHIQAHLFLTPQLYFGIVTFTHILMLASMLVVLVALKVNALRSPSSSSVPAAAVAATSEGQTSSGLVARNKQFFVAVEGSPSVPTRF